LATGLLDVNKLTPALSILLENERGARSHILAASIRFDGALEIEQSHGSGVYAAFMSQMAAEIRGQCQPLDLVAWGGPDRITLIRGQVRPEECRPWLDALAAKLRPRPPEGAKATEADARLEFTSGAVGIDRARAVPGHDAKAVLARIDAALLQADCTQTLLAFLQDDQAQPCQAA
jgi:GGDEF domain-containing protein